MSWGVVVLNYSSTLGPLLQEGAADQVGVGAEEFEAAEDGLAAVWGG